MGVAAAPIRFASFLGDNAFDFYRQVVGYLGAATGLPVVMVPAPVGPDAHLAPFEQGDLDVAFSCGLPYVTQADGGSAPASLLAAPVMPAERYGGRPVYFADVIVRHDSSFQNLAALRGARFAYNQDTSFSGYVLPRHHLLTQNETLGFFGAAVPTGSHAASMDWVADGLADCAAIDSVVLEMEQQQRPARAAVFRVVESIGPAPMPPVIAARHLPHAVRARLSAALLAMHTVPDGEALLRRGGVLHFAPVADQDYDAIRTILQALAA